MRIGPRLALREILNGGRFSVFFVLSLVLGLLGFVTLDAFKATLGRELLERSKYFLAADLSVSANRELTPEENAVVDRLVTPGQAGVREGKLVEFSSMAAPAAPVTKREGEAALPALMVEVRAVDDTYPFYGELEMKSGARLRRDGAPFERGEGGSSVRTGEGGSAVRTSKSDAAVAIAQASPIAAAAPVAPAAPTAAAPVAPAAPTASVAPAPLNGPEPVVWIYPEVADQLGVASGDRLRIGRETFRIAEIVLNDTGNSFRGALLAPRVYIGQRHLVATGLLGRRSYIFHRRLFKLPPDVDLRGLGDRLFDRLKDPAVVVETHFSRSDQVGRGILGYVTDYLGIISLVGLFLAALGTAYLLRSFLSERLREIAVLICLGVPHRRAARIYWLQGMILGALAGLLALAAAWPLLPALGKLMDALLPFELRPRVLPRSAAAALALGVGVSAAVGYPLTRRIRRLPAVLVFHADEVTAEDHRSFGARSKELAAWIPAAAAFWLLSVYEATSWVTGSLFFGALAGSLGLLAAAGWVGAGAIGRLGAPGAHASLPLRLAARNLARSRLGSVACFVSIGLGALLLGLIPQLEGNISSELTSPPGVSPPSFFLFDIQDDQLEPVRDYLKTESVEPQHVSPVVQVRLASINGQAFAKANNLEAPRTREEERVARSRNRSFNLSWRERLSASETVTSGKLWNGRYSGDASAPGAPMPELSVEKGFAKRLELKLGDTLGFDVQGVPVTGRITSIRRISWTSYEPNFFMLIQPGAIDDAPKTWLASIPSLPLEKRLRILRDLSARFPNVSLVDVNLTIQKTVKLVLQMGWALEVMAALAIAAGFFVLFAIARHQAATRTAEINLLKVLGARFADVRAIFRLEFALLGLASAGLGVALSYVVSYLISAVLFEGLWLFWWRTPLLIVALVTLLSMLTASLATRRILAMSPAELLQEAP